MIELDAQLFLRKTHQVDQQNQRDKQNQHEVPNMLGLQKAPEKLAQQNLLVR
jgi:hypothetical protein